MGPEEGTTFAGSEKWAGLTSLKSLCPLVSHPPKSSCRSAYFPNMDNGYEIPLRELCPENEYVSLSKTDSGYYIT